MHRALSRESFAKEMMRHHNFIGDQAIFGAHQDLSETALEKERKLMMEKGNEDPDGDGSCPIMRKRPHRFPS